MSKHWFQAVIVLGAFAIAIPLHADQGKGKGKGNPHKNQVADRDDDRWESRGDYEYRSYGPNEGMPPGWNKGKKTGWGNCGMPPGQAKKYGCQSYRYQGRDYYYYHDDIGRIIVRRPHIHIDVY
ncbi:MAG: hypothetical protein DMG64_13110 [Acidobacteria bacterium]|nr:MAG: hypothetical protein DMG64_13110 [Acidobacteriota bacterium]PYY23679.1 MAG: hypothetical protein DMG62_06760 [Acidobacteriota bacterium]